MRVLLRHHLAVVLLAVCLGVSGVLTAGPAVAVQQATLTGRVVDSGGDPLERFLLTAYTRQSNGTWKSVASARTDAEGEFSLEGRSAGSQSVRVIVSPDFSSRDLGPQYPPWPDFHAPQWIGGGVDWQSGDRHWGPRHLITDDEAIGTTYELGAGGTSVSGIEVMMTTPAGVVGIDPHSEAGDDEAVEVRYRVDPSADEQTLVMATEPDRFVVPDVFAPGDHTLSYRVAGTASPWRTALVSVTAGALATAELETPNEIGMLSRPVELARGHQGVAGWPTWELGSPDIEASVSGADTSWQWYRGDTPIPGETRRRLVTPPREGHGQVRLKVTVSKAGYPAQSWFTDSYRAAFPVIALRLSRSRVKVYRGNTVVAHGRVRMSDGSRLRDYTSDRVLHWRQACPAQVGGVDSELPPLPCTRGEVRLAADDTFRFRLPRHLRARNGIVAHLDAPPGRTYSPVAPLTVTRYSVRIRITADRRTARVGQRVSFRIHVAAPTGVLRRRMPVVYLEPTHRRWTLGASGRDGQVVRAKMARAGKIRVAGYAYGGGCQRTGCPSEDYRSARSNVITLRVRR